MKELSIEEKAQRYDEALGKARRYYDKYKTRDNILYVEDMEDMFPELKESEDERIRNWLISTLKSLNSTAVQIDGAHEMMLPAIAWLEKQCKNSVRWNENTDGNKPQKNHSVLMKTTHGIAEGEWKGDDSWIQYRWSISIKDSDVLFWIELSDLEKRGEKGIDGNEREIPNSEQKPADKVEPKFKVGDWVVYCNEDVDLITGIEENGYRINNGGYIPFMCASDIRLWTIKDAKDGDVLCSNQIIVLFKQWEDNTGYSFVIAHAGIDISGKLQITDGHWLISNESKPATKEQRDLLFSKMHKAGYEWDAEKKELKKIEQNPAWSEDDKNVITAIIAALSLFAKEKDAEGCFDMEITWLQFLKERYTWKPSLAQMNALSIVSKGNAPDDMEAIVSLYNDLKKLKEK